MKRTVSFLQQLLHFIDHGNMSLHVFDKLELLICGLLGEFEKL